MTNIITTGMRPVALIGIWPEASEAGHFYRKNFLLDSLTKYFQFHFWFWKVFDYVTKLQKIYFLKLLAGLTGLSSKLFYNDQPHSWPWSNLACQAGALK